MAFCTQLFHYIGVKLIKFTGEEETAFDAMFLQCTDNSISTVRFIGGSKDKRYLFLRWISANDTTVYIYVLITLNVRLLHTFFLHGGEIISETSCSVHGWFVRGVVMNGIMIYHQVRLETFIILSGSTGNTCHVYSAEAFENSAVYRAVYETACSISYTCVE